MKLFLRLALISFTGSCFWGMSAEVFTDLAQTLSKVQDDWSVTVISNLQPDSKNNIYFLEGTQYKLEHQGKKAFFFVKNGSAEDFAGNLLTQGTEAVVDAANSEINPWATVSAALYNAFTLYKPNAKWEDWQKNRPKNGIAVGTAWLNSNPDVWVKSDNAGAQPMRVIHAVGPSGYDGSEKKNKLLFGAYTSALEEAQKAGLKSVSFPLLSMGAFLTKGTDPKIGMGVAVDAILTFLCQMLQENEDGWTVHLMTYNDSFWCKDLNSITQSWLQEHKFKINLAV